jgi:hypothetical protein
MLRRLTVAALTGATVIVVLTLRWAYVRPPHLSEGQGWLRQAPYVYNEYAGTAPTLYLTSSSKPDLLADLDRMLERKSFHD